SFSCSFFLSVLCRPPISSLFPYTTLFRSIAVAGGAFAFSDVHDWSNLASPTGSASGGLAGFGAAMFAALWAYSGWQYLPMAAGEDRKSTRLNSSHQIISYAVFCLKKKRDN